jgi:hypothetical protein
MKLMSELKRQDKILWVFSVQAVSDDMLLSNPLSNIGITNTHAVTAAGCGWEVQLQAFA